MKTGKGFAVLIIWIVLGSCFNPPEFPNVPEIAFDHIEFNEGVDTDSLVLYITFKDGDGDLGLSAQNIEDLGAPFNNIIYYQTSPNIVDGKRELIPLHTDAVTAEVIINKTRVTQTYHVLDIPDRSIGELVSIRTREKSGFEFLPPYVECGSYLPPNTTTHLLIAAADTVVLDKHATFIDTLYNTENNNSPVYEVQDVLYRTINPDHYNIEVDFLIKDPNSTSTDHPGFTEFDWSAQPYCMTFDGRFPDLSDSNGALEGTLRYSMESRGFTSLFGIDTPMKLRIQIKDHALHRSNVIYTNVFTLQQI